MAMVVAVDAVDVEAGVNIIGIPHPGNRPLIHGPLFGDCVGCPNAMECYNLIGVL